MSYDWKRIGTFEDAHAADRWCDRQDIDFADRDYRTADEGVEVYVRSSAAEGREDRPGSRGFF